MRLLCGVLATLFILISLLYFVPTPQIIDNYLLRYFEELYGNKRCDPQQEAFIRQLADQYGIDNDSFVIRCANTAFMQQASYANAGVVPFGYGRFILFISSNYLAELSLEQRNFLLSHELMHIKNHDSARICHFSFVAYSAILFLLIILYYVSTYYLDRYRYSYALKIVMLLLVWAASSTILHLIKGWYSRLCEKRADIQACTHLRSCDGALSWIDYYHATYHRTALSSSYLSTHPSNQERIAYLKELKRSLIFQSQGKTDE